MVSQMSPARLVLRIWDGGVVAKRQGKQSHQTPAFVGLERATLGTRLSEEPEKLTNPALPLDTR